MSSCVMIVAVFSLFSLLISPSLCNTICSSQRFSKNRNFHLCNDLPVLDSYLHWTFNPIDLKLKIAFVSAPATPNGWISWGINPTANGMVGTQAFIAFRGSNDTVTVKTYNIKSYSLVRPSPISIKILEMEGEFKDGMMTLYASLQLPANTTTVNHVWQVGGFVDGTTPRVHSFSHENLASFGKLDLFAGHSASNGNAESRLKKKNIHGILSAVSWGILFPIGVIIARYVKRFPAADPAWFYLHITCQISAYIIGVVAWAMGLKLGTQSKGGEHTAHRNIGITLFAIATLQLTAMKWRPAKDHKYRKYWNIYHMSGGYTVVIMGIINVFKGLRILNPGYKWEIAYTAFISTLGALCLIIEAITWIQAFKKRSDSTTSPTTQNPTINEQNHSDSEIPGSNV